MTVAFAGQKCAARPRKRNMQRLQIREEKDVDVVGCRRAAGHAKRLKLQPASLGNTSNPRLLRFLQRNILKTLTFQSNSLARVSVA